MKQDGAFNSKPRIVIARAVSIALIASTALTACTMTPPVGTPTRAFDFTGDTFAYTNNNYWTYDLDSDPNRPVVKERRKNIDHGQRCTIMSRAARQFFYGAHFDPNAPKLDESEYRKRIRSVLETNPRRTRPMQVAIVIPGYPDLRTFSIAHESLLKDELAGRWIGYFQRGNWRMIFPFSPDQNRATGLELIDDLNRGHLPLVHVANYPRVDINHTVLLFEYEESDTEITFEFYDPNNADHSGTLALDRASAIFSYNRTDYFVGGPAQVYEIYDGLLF